MAIVAGTQNTYDINGEREDLSDMIWDVSPVETPVLSAMKKVKATNAYHEWQTDALGAAAANAQLEGDEASFSVPTATARIGNYCQILSKSAIVSRTTDVANKAGRSKEMAYQVARRMKEMKKDLEYAMIGLNNVRVAGGDTTAREMSSISCYLATNDVFNSGGTPAGASPTGTGVDVRTDSGTQQAFTEAMLTSALQSCYTNGADPTMLVAGAFNRAAVSAFNGSGQTRYVSTDSKTLNVSIDVYEGDFATLKVVPCRQIRTRDVLLLDPEYLAFAEFDGLKATDLAKTGDASKKLITWEGTLEVCTEKAHGGVFDLTTS